MVTSTIPTDHGAVSSKPATIRKHGIFRNSNLHRWLRTFHRGGALLAGIFMAVLGLAGAIISFELLLAPDGTHGGRGLFSSTVHFTIMDLHTFFIFGKTAGLTIEIFVFLALVYFSISGLWFYAVLYRQWLKLATKDQGGFAPSKAFRTANRFLAWIVSILTAVVVILCIVAYFDWTVSRPLALAARDAGLPPPPPAYADATARFFALKGDVILTLAGALAFIYFCVVGFGYSGKIYAAWRRTKAARAGQPAQPGKAMRTIHRWISVPFGLYMIVIAATGLLAISGLWANNLPWLSSAGHLQNLKVEAIEARNRTLPPDKQIPLPRSGPGAQIPPGASARIETRNRTLSPNMQIPLPRSGPGAQLPRGGSARSAYTCGVCKMVREMIGGTPPPVAGQRGEAPRGQGPRAGGQQGNRPPDGFMRAGPFYGRVTQYGVHQLHTGAVFGTVGQIFVMFAGLALAMFSISGIWMYVSMYMPRRASGRKALFWH